MFEENNDMISMVIIVLKVTEFVRKYDELVYHGSVWILLGKFRVTYAHVKVLGGWIFHGCVVW